MNPEPFADTRKAIYSTKSIKVRIESSLLNSPDDLPDDTTIEGDNRLMEELFGTNTGKIDWISVKERFRKFPNTSGANLSALKEISRAVFFISNNNKVLPVQGTIFVKQGPKRYRPVISHAEEVSTGHIDCEILLIEEVGGQLINVDKSLGALLTGIGMAVRVRWEIVQPFVANLRILAALDPRNLRLDLQTGFNNIFIDAEFRGSYSPADLWDAFESSADKSKLLDMIEKFDHTYRKIWKGLGFMDVTGAFSEVSDQPFSDQDLALLDTGLRELAEMNRDYIVIAVARAAVLVRHLFTLEEEGEQLYRPERTHHRYPDADLLNRVESTETPEKTEAREGDPAKLRLNDSAGLEDAVISIRKRDRAFISYSHQDHRLFEEFKTMLAPVIQGGKVDAWDDNKIAPGAKWKDEIRSALGSAKIAVLLVSQNFLASDFIAKEELPQLLKAAQTEGVTVFWIYLSPCLYQQTEIVEYQAAHDVSKALSQLNKAKRQEVLKQICYKLLTLL